MKQTGDKYPGAKKDYEDTTLPIPFTLKGIKEDITIVTNQPYKENIINQAISFHLHRLPYRHLLIEY